MLYVTAFTSVLLALAPIVPATATGVVVEAGTGAVIPGAFVQQEGGVTSAFTTANGAFRVLLEPQGQPRLVVSHVGFETAMIPVGTGLGLRVTLKPIRGFVPPSEARGSERATSANERVPLNTGVIFAYRLRQQSLTAGSASVTGLVNNDFRLGTRVRWYPWLAEAEGAHYQFPVDVPGLGRDENPAFSPSTWQAGARLGRLWSLRPDLEGALGVGYRYTNTVPNNRDVPFTGSAIDHEQTRHAGGVTGTVGWRRGGGPWQAEGHLGLYPLTMASAKAPGAPYGGSFLTDLRAGVGYEVMRGLRLGVGYQLEDWRGGAGADSSHILSLNMQYTPGGIPQGTEP